MKRLAYSIIVVIGLVFSSCVVRKNATPVSTINTQINLNYDDLEYIGEVSGTSTQNYLFGVIPIGGRRNHQGVFAGAMIAAGPNFNPTNKRGVMNALYDALGAKPDADYIIPVSYKVETHVMAFGRREIITIRAKAVKIRPKQPEPQRPEKPDTK
jgi:hypothetical protein